MKEETTPMTTPTDPFLAPDPGDPNPEVVLKMARAAELAERAATLLQQPVYGAHEVSATALTSIACSLAAMFQVLQEEETS